MSASPKRPTAGACKNLQSVLVAPVAFVFIFVFVFVSLAHTTPNGQGNKVPLSRKTATSGNTIYRQNKDVAKA